MDNKCISILGSSVRAATTNSANQNNYGNKGLHLVVDITAVPGVDTVTPKIQGYDPVSGKYYDILVGAATAITGTTVLKVYPGITAAGNVSVSDILPLTWRVVMTHSAGTDFTYSVSANLV